MNPISLNGGAFPSPYAALRSGFPLRKAGGSGVEEPSLDSVACPPSPGQAPANFDNLLGNFVKEVNGKQMNASDAVTGMLSGQNVPLHQTMLAMEEASVSFQLMVEVRNKLLEGYQELIRMQV